MTFKLTGVKELDNALRQFEPKLVKKIARKVVRKAAKPVQESAQRRVRVKTGRLKRSIKVRALKRSRKNKHRVGVRVITGEGFFQGSTFYGGFIEYGTKNMRKKPFMRPAMDENHETVRRVFQSEIAALIPQVAREVR